MVRYETLKVRERVDARSIFESEPMLGSDYFDSEKILIKKSSVRKTFVTKSMRVLY
jgi:hypothetical protein